MEQYGSNEYTRKGADLAKKIASLRNKRLGTAYDFLSKALEEVSDIAISIDITYQLTLVGIFKCECCCYDKSGNLSRFSGEWSDADVLTPAAIDPESEAEGWGKDNPFPADIENHVNNSRRELYFKYWKECKSKCGKK